MVFISEYGEHNEYILQKLKEALVPPNEDRIDIEEYIKFVQGFISLYEAFQYKCDPGTIVMCAGIVDDFGDAKVPSPQIIESLLGLNITQVSSFFFGCFQFLSI